MSQQGTPFGMSGATFSYCPLSKASAAPHRAARHEQGDLYVPSHATTPSSRPGVAARDDSKN
jgi:hypothetical protein